MVSGFVVVAGQAAEQAREASKLANVKPGRYEDTFDSETLVAWQCNMDRWEAVELVKSIYGWSVRSASGLQNFALLASSRHREVDGSLEDAKRWAAAWVERYPKWRYAYVREVAPALTMAGLAARPKPRAAGSAEAKTHRSES